MNLLQRMGSWWSKMFKKEDVEQALKITVATSDEMLNAQRLWREIFVGQAPWNNSKVPSKMLGSGICTEVATAVTIEMETEVTGSPRADWLNEQYEKVINDIRQTTEKLSANGTIILRPYVCGNELGVNIFENNMFYPIKYDEKGNLVDVVFPYLKVINNKYYTLLERCTLENKEYSMSYTAWVSDNEKMLGKEVSSLSVLENIIPDWAKLDVINPLVFTEVEQPWFVVVNMPALNHIEQNSKQGMAIYSKVISELKKADLQEELTDHEYKAGRLKQQATSDLFLRDKRGPVFDSDIFEVFDTKMTEKGSNSFIDTYNPDFRFIALNDRQNQIKRDIEFGCGLSFGIISDPISQDKTATEVEAGKQRFYTTISDIQKVLENALKQLVVIMNDMADRYNLAPQGVYDMSFWWDDSIMITAEEKMAQFDAELNRLIRLNTLGAVDPAEIRAFFVENSDYFSKLSPEMIEKARKELPRSI